MSAKSHTRRHDLDALRALAMLLGVLLHALMSFLPGFWPIQDSTANPALGAILVLIHGFRMPLFFLVSGFFTALVWRRRGLKALLQQRLIRILLPCVLGVLTLVPLYRAVLQKARATAPRSVASSHVQTLLGAVQQGNVALANQLLDTGADPSALDSQFGATPLSWAAMRGDSALVSLLLEHGAKVSQPNVEGSTPLHCAALLGNEAVVSVLLKHGADVGRRSQRGDTPAQLTYTDSTTTQRLIGLLGLPARSPESIAAGQERCRRLLPASAPRAVPLGERLRDQYGTFLRSPWFANPIFEHLWFLWFLCWLLPLFALWTRVASRVSLARTWVLSPRRYLWLLSLTLVPQLFMGITVPSFGPDTATGLVPPPHLLAYYACFFFFGATYYEADDTQAILGRHWRYTLSVALTVILPLGLVTMTGVRFFSDVLQVVYAWLMVFGLLGLARHALSKENRHLQYLASASYWLYLMHLPLVVALQLLVRDSPLPLIVKLVGILVGTIGVLLVAFEFLVRPLQRNPRHES